LDQFHLGILGIHLNLYFLGILGILYHQLLQLLLVDQLNRLNQDRLEGRLILGILHYLDYQ